MIEIKRNNGSPVKVFAIEYKRFNFSWFPWKNVDKTFKTKPKAEEYIRKHFSK